jgi:hypothetical protein
MARQDTVHRVSRHATDLNVLESRKNRGVMTKLMAQFKEDQAIVGITNTPFEHSLLVAILP